MPHGVTSFRQHHHRPLLAAALAVLAAVVAPPVAVRAQGGPAAPLSALRWRSVGPYIRGRVVAVTGVRGDPDLFYMGAVDGGVWKSTDYGIEWTSISDSTLPGASSSIGAIAVAPSNPDVIYVGTGESDIRGDMITGDGVFRTADGGKTWRPAGLDSTHTISGLIVDPRNPDVVYASSLGHVFVPGPERGVFKTTDAGRTWQRVLFVNDSTGIVDLVMAPGAPDVLYAAAWQAYRTPWSLSSGGAGSGLYKSIDGGERWTNLSRNPGLPRGLLGKIGIAVAPSAPNVLYATIQAKGGGVFRSDDGGNSWTRVNAEWKLRQRAFYYMAIFVDPKDPNTVYMPQVDALYVSRDAGKTFTQLDAPHGDHHTLWINPDDPAILLEGNDGGATVSTDSGKTWSTVDNQPTGQFYDVNIDGRFPFHVYGAQQDEGSTEGPSASVAGAITLGDWKTAAGGESTPSVPVPGHPEITFGADYYDLFMAYDQAIGEDHSVSPSSIYHDGGSSAEMKYRFAWTHPILFSPNDSNELLIGSQYVMRSDDHGATWKTISPDLTRNDPATEAPTGGPIDLDQTGAEVYPTVSALAVSPGHNGVIWAGSSDGLVHVTTDDGAHWQDVTPPTLPKWSDVSSIEPSHVDRGTAYLTARRYMWDDFTPYVFKTTDFGRHWTSITSGLPKDEYAFVIRQDPADSSLFFLGTKSTVFVSLDGAGSWRPLALNLPPVQVRGIAIDARQGDVAIATHGRAFWILDNLSLLEQMTARTAPAPDSAALFAPERAWLTHAYGSSDYGSSSAGQNPAFGATVFLQVPKGYDGKTPITLSFTDSTGALIREFHLHLKDTTKTKTKAEKEAETPIERRADALEEMTAIEPGMNRVQWNLRYADATEVQGFQAPGDGDLNDDVDGPEVVPGVYRVVLHYGERTMATPLDVTLDPRIHVGTAALAQRLAFRLRIRSTLDSLDGTLNHAIAVRDSLAAAGRDSAGLAPLTGAIDSLVQLAIQSSEGDVLHEPKLRGRLGFLAGEVDMAYVAPNAAEEAAYREMAREAEAGEARLRDAIASVRVAR
jgi:Sortilin, neurotensin receptor 3,